MRRRVFSFLLAAVLVISAVAVSAPTVSAKTMTSSEELIELLKLFEGFTSKPVGDYGQFSIGYGTACDPADYPNGITKAEAEKLMREVLVKFEGSVNNFARKYGLNLTQNQFDALVSFTYNLGPNWLNNDSTLRSAIISGATGNDFIYAITMWCTAGVGDEKTILTNLVRRRLCEANVYLNGVYSNVAPANYDYVTFNTKMEDAANTARIQGYDSRKTDSVRPNPTKSGYRFLGWYTAASGGEWITTLNADTAGDVLYGHWQKGDGDVTKGVKAKYKRTTVRDADVYNLETGKVVGKIQKGTTVTIKGDYMDANGVKWGLTGDGWIKLNTTGVEGNGAPVQLKVTVNTDGVNIRTGPGTNFAKAGKVNKGEVLTLTAVKQGANYLWGQFSGGWICLDYTNYDQVSKDNSTESEEVTATGVIVKTDKLNVRNRPGTSGTKVVGSYARGDVVKITLRQTVRGTVWGKTEKGWISLYYVQLKTSAETEKPEEEDKENDKEDTDDNGGASDKVMATGVITNCDTLRVRKGPGTNYAKVGSLAAGTEVKIYETTGGGKQLWGRIDQGWVSMNYVELDVKISDSETGKEGVVCNCDKLNVRSGAGTSNRKVAKLNAGTKVQVFETKEVKGVLWGRISLGWVSMEYIKLSGTTQPEPEKPETEKPEEEKPESDKTEKPESSDKTAQTGTIVKSSQVRIRAGAGTKYDKVGTLNKGDRVVILETVKVGSATWGRTDKGWIHMYYVKLDGKTVPEGAAYKTVTTNGLRIRAGAGTNHDKVGSYNKGDVVLIYEQTTVKNTTWGRTDKGWISMDYVK